MRRSFLFYIVCFFLLIALPSCDEGDNNTSNYSDELNYEEEQSHEPWNPTTLPNPYVTDSTQYVTDPLHYLDSLQIDSLNTMASKIFHETGLMYYTVILDKLSDEYDDFKFALTLYNTWQIGYNDNGLLLLVVMDSHQWRFITGYGAEEKFTDAVCARLGHNCLVPNFKKGNYFEGLTQASLMINLISEDKNVGTIFAGTETEEEQTSLTSSITSSEEDDTDDSFNLFHFLSFISLTLIGFYKSFKSKTGRNLDPDSSEKLYETLLLSNDKSRVTVSTSGFLTPTVNIWKNKTWHFILEYLPMVPIAISVYYAEFEHVIFYVLCYYSYLCFIHNCKALLVIWKKRKEDVLEAYKLCNVKRKDYKSIIFFFIAPAVQFFFTIIYTIILQRYKRLPIKCPICQQSSRLLTKKEAETALSDAQKYEREKGVVKYRVGECENHHFYYIRYRKMSYSFYEECETCHTRTCQFDSEKIIREATYSAAGKKVVYYKCACCGAIRPTEREIPKLLHYSSTTRSSGGWSSGHGHSHSSSRGGHSGGGRSGGGGAGGRW